jgi:hypothetical protein
MDLHYHPWARDLSVGDPLRKDKDKSATVIKRIEKF